MKKNVEATTATIKHRLFDGTEILTHHNTLTILCRTRHKNYRTKNRIEMEKSKARTSQMKKKRKSTSAYVKAHRKYTEKNNVWNKNTQLTQQQLKRVDSRTVREQSQDFPTTKQRFVVTTEANEALATVL